MTDSTTVKKLYRSGVQKMIGGVCGGVAEYLRIDPTLVRVVWSLAILFNGIGILAYIACLVFVPMNPAHAGLAPAVPKNGNNFGVFIGITIVFIGVMFLFNNIFNFIWPFHWRWYGFWPFHWHTFWPLILVAFGGWYIYYTMQKDKQSSVAGVENEPGKTRLYRSRSTRMISGVCGGLAHYWHVDVNIIRIAFIIMTFLTHIVLGLGIYIALIILAPEEPLTAPVNKADDVDAKQNNQNTTEVQNA